MIAFAHDPVSFVLLTGMVFFAWGEIYSLFPATCGDTFGRKFAATNYGLLYTAKGTAALLVPLGSMLRDATGDWYTVLYAAAGVNLLAAGARAVRVEADAARVHTSVDGGEGGRAAGRGQCAYGGLPAQ